MHATSQLKQARLDAITDEVQHFHPLLKVLLPKLPGVEQCEYTHGPNEMGADFVLLRKEEVFGDPEYIGVIAKIGKIVQNFSDVERQIEECELERTFGGGHRKVYIRGIWILSTGQISHGAQEKIFAKYKTRKIQFIDGERLSTLIDTHLSNYWTEVSLHIGDYLHSVWNENDRLDRSLSLLPTNDARLYIDQDVYEAQEFTGKLPTKHRRIDIFETLSRHDVLLIEGGMGSGKSKLLRRLVDFYATPQQFLKESILPVSCTFKEFVDQYKLDPQKAVAAIVPASVRDEASSDVKYLLLLDGADEKDFPADELVKVVADAAKAVSSAKMKAVITSRWCEAYDGNPTLQQSVTRLELHHLSTARLIEFIQKLCSKFNLKSRLIEDLKNSILFKDLPKSPIAAILLAQLFNENAEELPSNLTELYAKYTELSLGRWDVDKKLQTQRETEALSNIIVQMAEHFLNNQLDEMSVDEAQGFFRAYLSKRNLGLDAQQLFHKLVTRCDIISVDLQRGTFRFKHRSFAEFFYAKAHFKKPLLIDHRVWSPYWISCFYFYVGLQKDCPELLQEIINVQPESEGQRWMRVINIPNYLLAGFSSPYETIEDGVYTAVKEAAVLYEEIANGTIDSPFGVFPKMHFLYLVRSMIYRGYGFEFFKKAVETAAVKLDYECTDRTLCAVALYFLSVVSLKLGQKYCFDFLIEKYAQSLPIEFELAIKHDCQDVTQRSHHVKKLEKRFSRSLKGNPGLQRLLQSFYDRPLRKELARVKETRRIT
jgi:hypothetical protein